MRIFQNSPCGKNTAIQLSVSLTILFLFLFGCEQTKQSKNLITHSEFLMDTIVEFKIPDNDPFLSRSDIDKAIEDASSEMHRIYKKYNPHDPDSVLSKINNSEQYLLDDETQKLLSYAIQLATESSGNFDPSIFTLEQKLWSPLIKGKRLTLPTQTEIKSALKSVGINKIKLNGKTLIKPRNIRFDFGAFVKGYAVDCAVNILKKHNISSALINAGGDLSCYGKRKWRIAIKHPRSNNDDKNEQKKFLGVITVSNTSIATSGDYERFVTIDGKRYHHIIEPSSGKPADKSISVTIISDKSCMEADALSTAVFVMGPEEGLNFIKSYSRTNTQVEGLIVDPDGKFFMTEGFKKFKLEF